MSLDVRRVTRCLQCDLKQFETKSMNCRRCSAKLVRGVGFEDRIFDWHKGIGLAAKAYRMAWDLKQQDAAVIQSGARGTLSRIETKGVTSGTIYRIEKLSSTLHVPIAWLLQEVTEDRLAEIFAVRCLQAVRETALDKEAVVKLVLQVAKEKRGLRI